jgi:hypothetical protein
MNFNLANILGANFGEPNNRIDDSLNETEAFNRSLLFCFKSERQIAWSKEYE